MKVKMTARLNDTWHENGEWRSYPDPGEVLDTSDTHGADLCAQGYAKPVAQKDADVETRDSAVPDADARGAESDPGAAEDETPARPPVNAPKADWQAYAVAQGMPEDDASSATKNDLIAEHGG